MMVKKPKYPPRELNEEDLEILDKAILNYVAISYALMKQYRTPKKFAKKILLNAVKSDSNIATIFTMAYIKNSTDGELIRPGELNEKLANDIRNAFHEQYVGLASQLQNNEFNKKFLNSRALREGVLKKFEDQGILIHLSTKDEIVQRQGKPSRSRGRTASKNVYSERGGKLSAYTVAGEVERLKKAMKKPGGIDYLYRKLIKSGLAENMFKFMLLAFLYAAKMDKKILDMTMGAGAAFLQESQSRVNTTNNFQRLQKIDESKLEPAIESQIKSIVKDQGYYVMLFFAGLFKNLDSLLR
jgi:hypothetical protein